MANLTSQPVSQENDSGRVKDGIALCLSGGGYRAMLFHVGSLWRLNELGLLQTFTRVSSVSGGSITAAKLGIEWQRLQFRNGVATNIIEVVFEPLMRLASQTIDVPAVIMGFIWPGLGANWIQRCYNRSLYGGRTLRSLPTDDLGPRFVINATNLQTTVLWRFSRPYMGDYVVGRISDPILPIATAVAASSAFPPLLSPVILRNAPEVFDLAGGQLPEMERYQRRTLLADGGVYDNLGLEPAWKRCGTILVSDGGQKVGASAHLWSRWLPQAKRVLDVVDNQVRSLRKRWLIEAYIRGERRGTYWGVRTDIGKYQVKDALSVDLGATQVLASIPTRLKRLTRLNQELLVNWGYAVCDAAVRRHLDRALPKPVGFPFPDVGVK